MFIKSPEYYGLIVKRIRINSNITQQQLSKKVGINRTTISLIEQGKANISITTAIKILSILGYEMEVKINGE
ncbi:hypothetical protein FACS189459_1280 [Bacilli bacterium]|nr:hypothetical protein FACS189459_1280 [Bacilli bacterium]